MNYSKLKEKGYYLRVQKGMFKNQHHTEFSLVKNLTEDGTRKKIACLVNLATYRILKADWGFKSVADEQETRWLTRPESYDFHTQTKEPLILNWLSN